MPKIILKLANDVSTDAIYPGRFMATVLPSETPRYIFADNTSFNSRAVNNEFPAGSIIAAESNFGCGSSREQAVSAIKGYDFIVIAKNFARIFLQNAINLGLRCIVCPDFEASEDDEIEILPDRVRNVSIGKEFAITPLPQSRQAIIDAGGLIPYTRRRLTGETSSAG
jgi:3-isopropylmalate/(R)-2-methylmalate dehydratase small subunit